MLLVSQNKERIYWFGRAFNSLGYHEDSSKISKTGKKETIRHTICISDWCLEEIAEYESKERCLEVMKDFCEAHRDECYTIDFYDSASQANRAAAYRNNIVFEFPNK